MVISEFAEFLYKTADSWHTEHERSIIWNDPTLNIQWPPNASPLLSVKGEKEKHPSEAEAFA